MPDLSEKLQKIELLRQKIEKKGEIPQAVLRKIDYKFRLECNYHSNRMEGGTLTKQETRGVMMDNISVKDKPLKDIREMKGHDLAMLEILRVGSGEARLSEARIKNMHKLIIVPEKPDKENEVGYWKKTGNHIYNYRGEKFNFTEPELVPEAIHDLLNWLNRGLDKISEKSKEAPDPLLLCFEFHLKYLTIHPFSDGNGRTARLLTNLVLISLGYPPIWVSEEEEKDAYNKYLADIQSYGSSPDLFFTFMAGLMERSLQLVMDAIDGKEIENMDDWKKKLVILKSNLPDQDAVRIMKTKESMEEVLLKSIKPTVQKAMEELSLYDDMFLQKQIWFGMGGSSTLIQQVDDLDNIHRQNHHLDSYSFNYNLDGFKKVPNKQFSVKGTLIWKLENYTYAVHVQSINSDPQYIKKYDEFYSLEEIGSIVSSCGQSMFEVIREKVEG